jgi:hypothetical protein
MADAKGTLIADAVPLPIPPVERSFTIVRGSVLEPVEDPTAIPAEDARPVWEPLNFAELDEEIAWRSALAVHNRRVAEARLEDAKKLEAQIDKLLLMYFHLVPAPVKGKAWRESIGDCSGGKYRFQPERAVQYELVNKELAKAKGLTREYVQLKPDSALIKEWERQHGADAIPGILRKQPGPVTFKPLGSREDED